MKELLQLGSWERSGHASGCPCVILWSAGLLCSGVGSTFYCPRFWRGLCVWPSSQRRSGSWPCCLSPSPGVGSASAAWQVLLFTWAFPCVGLPRMVGLLAALLEVCLPGLSGWCPFRVPQILWLTSLPREWSCFWFWHSGTGVATGNVPYSHHGFTPGAGLVLSVSVFSGWFSVLKVLVLKCQVLPFSWALTLLACCLGLRGTCPVVTLPGVPL